MGSSPPATSTMTLISSSSSRSAGSAVISFLSISTKRALAGSRTSTRFRQSSTPARRASCDCHVSIRSATCVPTVPRPMSPTLRGADTMGAILPAVTLVLREADVARVIQMDPVIAAVEAAMRELGAGVAQNEPRRRAFAPGGMLNVMFAAYPGGGYTGLKAYTVAAGQVRFLVVQFALDGSLQALIEADLMGAYRTGAASAVAVRALGPRGPATVALIGAGHQARTQALAISRVLEIKELRVFARDPAHRSAFAAEQGKRLGIRVTAASSAEAAVRGADVVVTMTTSSVPVIEASWIASHA